MLYFKELWQNQMNNLLEHQLLFYAKKQNDTGVIRLNLSKIYLVLLKYFYVLQ